MILLLALILCLALIACGDNGLTDDDDDDDSSVSESSKDESSSKDEESSSSESSKDESNSKDEESSSSESSKDESSSKDEESSKDESSSKDEESSSKPEPVPTFEISFDSNGGSKVDSQNVKKGDPLTKPADPTKEGYTLEGWYVDGEKWSFVGYVVTREMTLVAKWTPNNNTIVFNANGGTGSMSNQAIATNASANLSANVFTRAGYTFMGWSTTADGEVEYANGASYTMGANSTYTLYAVWEINTYTITYNKDGGTESTPNPTTFTINDLPLSLNYLNDKADKIFVGWYTQSDFSGAPVTEITEIGDIELFACYSTDGVGLTFTQSNTGWEITGFNGSPTAVVIPSYYRGTAVTSIGYNAFRGCSSLTSITIPNSVKTIGSYAFYNCDSLTSITIPNSVTSIGEDAFSYCDSLTSVTIGNSVTSIEWCAFSYCASLTSVTIGDSVETIGYRAFYDCNSLTSITIPNSVTSIGSYAFGSCTSLTSVTIGNSVKTIGEFAFVSCASLTSVTIGNSVTSIGSGAFSSCYNLVEVYNLSSLNITAGSYDNEYVGRYAKVIHTSLDEPSILETVDDYIFMTWNDKCYLMGYVGNDTELTLPNNYKGNNYEIYQYAFYYRDDITRVTIPNSVTSIGSYAFSNCTSLTSVTIPNSVTEIGISAFNVCTSLTSVTIGDSVTSIGSGAFYNCYKLVEVYNLSSLNITKESEDNGYVGYYAKVIHTSLDEPSILETVGDYIFMTWEDKYYLVGYVGNETELTLPENYKGKNYEIYKYAFYKHYDITKVTIPNSITSIGEDAFDYCYKLTSVTIPNSVTSIGKYAFHGCASLTIYCEAEAQPSGWNSRWNYSSCPVYWYSESEPTAEGNYWHYGTNGEIIIWE